MLSDALRTELRKLNRADKLQAMQVLITELAVDEGIDLIPGATYELFTPYGNEAAAQVLQEMLDEAQAKDNR